MPVDPQYLRQHYASLSDDALLEIDRADLVEAAQKCYDDEFRRRRLPSLRDGRQAEEIPASLRLPDVAHEKADVDGQESGAGDKPEWMEDASEVYSRADAPRTTPAPDLSNAREALGAAGIPCYMDVSEIPEEKSASPRPTHLWRLLVPGKLYLRATSVLERDMFNADFEAAWKAQLEMLSDEELRRMNPQAVFCGLYDRVERVTKSYDEEIARRRLKTDRA
jgi:hypothetical protein